MDKYKVAIIDLTDDNGEPNATKTQSQLNSVAGGGYKLVESYHHGGKLICFFELQGGGRPAQQQT